MYDPLLLFAAALKSVALPVFLCFVLLRHRFRSRFAWCIHATLTSGWAGMTVLVMDWSMIGYYLRLAIAVLTFAFVTVSYVRNRKLPFRSARRRGMKRYVLWLYACIALYQIISQLQPIEFTLTLQPLPEA